MSSAHHEPTPQQLQPLLEKHFATWNWFKGMLTGHVIGIVIILALLAIFVV